MSSDIKPKSPKKKADLKVVILGESNVGKTSLIQRYIERVFEEDPQSTIGASFFLKQWGPYNVAIWDTAGEEKYSSLSSFYCRGASAAIVCYDITKASSLTTLHNRHLHLLQSAEPNCLIVIVGTKKDLIASESRAVSEQAGKELAEQQNANKTRPLTSLTQVPFFETSSKTGENVDNVFDFILQSCLPLNDSAMADMYTRKNTGVDLDKKTSSRDSTQGKCCGS
ncbi:ras-related protein Rab-20 [Exaiptasia diaphana]|uniref:Uncharacterized protein n=1 Tax=Exaiptasia diaphana TaxID=2652724 RepID=A0A913Y8H6_EXADI|nr:ras-related protein Rab-20 [Exaiptasia diaphana]KXJ21424.1 Ras-related protein Rab-20 [Exaiptasia diaphana]